MKHMGKVHVLKYILLLIVAIGVGVGGYEIGLSHTQNTKNYQVSKSSTSNTDNDSTSSVSQESSSDSTDEITYQDSSSSNDEKSNETSLFYDGTFAGYHNVHELANDGYTVTSYLITHEGMTAKQAHQFIRDNYDKLSGFLTSGEIQTMNEDNN